MKLGRSLKFIAPRHPIEFTSKEEHLDAKCGDYKQEKLVKRDLFFFTYFLIDTS